MLSKLNGQLAVRLDYSIPTSGARSLPHYFTHFYNSELLCDRDGQDFPSLRQAKEAARRTASELIAEHIVEGTKVNLGHRLDVMDETGQIVFVLRFADLFEPATPPT